MEDHLELSTDPVLRICQEVFRLPYPFPWQRLIIASVIDSVSAAGQGVGEPLRHIAVLPTGAGKSLCWMLPAVMISGITVAVFPLLSLMSDQERRLKTTGIRAVVLRGGQTTGERNGIWKELENGETRIVLTNPEMLGSPQIAARLGALKPEFLVVDETHTVSQWGETFRPACGELGALVEDWNPPAVLALTATAGPLIRERITALLFNGVSPTTALADPDRPSIRYGVIPTLSRNHTLEHIVRRESRPLIVFGPTRSSVAMAARTLRYRLRDTEIQYYHAGLSRQEKSRLESWFLESRDGVLCATCAYGMGVDKGDIRTVVHLSPPASVEAYLQETGRAARDGETASAWLIRTPEDSPDGGNPADALQQNRGAAVSGPAVTPGGIGYPAPARRDSMLKYASSSHRCRREMLLEALGIEAADCGGCDVCGKEPRRTPFEKEIILNVLRWNRGRFRLGQLARVLTGRRSAEIRRFGLDDVRGFGALAGWELEDAEEAVRTLMRTGEIRKSRRGGRLVRVNR